MAANATAFFAQGFANFRRSLRDLLGRYGVATNPGTDDGEIVSAFERLLAHRQTELDDDALIFMTEILIMARLELVIESDSLLETVVYTNHVDEMARTSLRKLLRISLQDKRFREKFNGYFQNHPDQQMRNEGWKWLSDTLVWES